MSQTYEPLAEEPFDTDAVPVKRRSRRSKKAAGGVGRTAAIVLLVAILAIIVVLAIALPIVLTRRLQQNAANASPDGSSSVARSAVLPNGNANSGSSNNNAAAGLSNTASGVNGAPAGAPSASAVFNNPAQAAGMGALAPVGANLNTGDDVFCYKSAVSGAVLEGAFRKTGKTYSSDGLVRAEVRSCGSGSKMTLLEQQLVPCGLPCLTPVWLAVQNGIIEAPIWTKQYVCRGDQVYENRMSSRYTFYWRFAGFVEEQLITRCDSDDAWWVPNVELSYCDSKQEVACQVAHLNRAKPEGVPVLVPGLPAGASSTPRPVCHKPHGSAAVQQSFWATGAVTNSFVFSRARFIDQIEVVPCNNRTAPASWLYIDDVVQCPGFMADQCVASADATTTTTTTTTSTTSSTTQSAAPTFGP